MVCSNIDVSRFIDALEEDVKSDDAKRRVDALHILRRWSDDKSIDPRCRRRARQIVRAVESTEKQ